MISSRPSPGPSLSSPVCQCTFPPCQLTGLSTAHHGWLTTVPARPSYTETLSTGGGVTGLSVSRQLSVAVTRLERCAGPAGPAVAARTAALPAQPCSLQLLLSPPTGLGQRFGADNGAPRRAGPHSRAGPAGGRGSWGRPLPCKGRGRCRGVADSGESGSSSPCRNQL